MHQYYGILDQDLYQVAKTLKIDDFPTSGGPKIICITVALLFQDYVLLGSTIF